MSSVELDPAATNYWHPQRHGVQGAPADFRQKLRDFHEDLAVTWHPIKERWLLWYRRPRVQHPLCPGWLLLAVAETSDGAYVPCDERMLAVAYAQSVMSHGSGVAYVDRVEQEHRRIKERRAASDQDDLRAQAGAVYDYQRIKNIGHGSKFADYQS